MGHANSVAYLGNGVGRVRPGPHLRPEFAERTGLGRGILTPTTRTSVWKPDAHR
jgi:hypothetical protein